VNRRLLLALVALLALMGGCGLSEDARPQAIPPENLPPDLLDPNPGSSTTLPESAGTTSVSVYFLEQVGDRERLVSVPREVNDPSSPGERVTALLTQPSATDQAQGFTTSIPADTKLLDVEENPKDKELVLHLSNQLFDVEGQELAKAFAQIVWTVTEPDAGDFRQVRFIVDSQPIRALDADGVEKEGAVTRADYTALAPR
jgi:spore germination protein GerM